MDVTFTTPRKYYGRLWSESLKREGKRFIGVRRSCKTPHSLSLSLPSRPRCNLFSFAHVTNSIHPALNLSLFLSRLIPIERRHCHPAHKTPPPLRGRHNFKFYAIYKMSRHYFCPLDLSLHTFGPSDNPIYVGVPPSPVIVCHRNARNLLLAVLSFPHQYFAALIK